MQGKVVVITGGTSGIGQVAAEQLAGMGARIVLVARDKARGEATLARLRGVAPKQEHSIHYADLSRLKEMKRVAREIAAAEPRIDVLMNNAGAIFYERRLTEDGLEMTFALNHMSYFVLAHGLRDRLLASAPSRIVNTSSRAHVRGQLDFDDLQSSHGFAGFKTYGLSKLLNILFTRELARRLAGTRVTANSLHPGFVATRFGDDGSAPVSSGILRVLKVFAMTPEKGAQTLVYLASSGDVAQTTGEYFYNSKPARPSLAAQDDDAAKRLWEVSATLAGLAD